MMANKEIYGLVLAGGKSRRMGTDKALLLHAGQSQLSCAVSLLERHLPQVFVSARSDQAADAERSRFPRIVDRYSDIGPVAGILSAMEHNPQVSWMVLACDLPNLDDATIATLIGAHSLDHPVTAYKSSSDGLPEPLCAIYSPSAHAIIADFVTGGLVCPRKMLIRSNTRLLDQANPEALANMNTPADLKGTGVRIAS